MCHPTPVLCANEASCGNLWLFNFNSVVGMRVARIFQFYSPHINNGALHECWGGEQKSAAAVS